jgi:hypothetical protein
VAKIAGLRAKSDNFDQNATFPAISLDFVTGWARDFAPVTIS